MIMQEMRLLLVDDEEDFRQTIARRLIKRGLLPEEASTGEECLSILEKKPMDVVVLDVKMPGMNGIEVLHHIKTKFPRTEVILLTGHATTQDGVEGIKSGAFDYLSKPIELEHLFRKIKQAHEKVCREEEKIRDAEFREKMEQQMIATERLASLGTLAAGIAHEINNPLAIINESVGWMHLLLKREEAADIPFRCDLKRALDKIEKSIVRARKITHQLLGFVGKDDFALTEVSLAELVDEALLLVSREAMNKEIEIVRDIDASLQTIWSDPYRLRQVLVNILTNAVHATGPEGRVRIIVEDMDQEVLLKVRDTGEGIPKENLDKIFEPFFTTKNPGQGTGLGLYVSRGIIERLGGRIDVKSELGNGTTFCVRLPKKNRTDEVQTQIGRDDLMDKINKYQ
ncbi:MAG: response regulator [Deltaproteobacteria bacterium]|nr:response regulator [Deltaproteobacteria bacterium]